MEARGRKEGENAFFYAEKKFKAKEEFGWR